MSLLIKKPGILTTVQDLGRYGYQRFGVNPSGAMDRTAARLVNLLVGNDETGAVLEMHFPADVVEFEADVVCAIGGADLTAEIDGRPIENWHTFAAHSGSTLRFKGRVWGSRAYLAVSGGLDIRPWLASTSTNLAAGIGGFEGRRLQAGDRLAINCTTGIDSKLLHRAVSPSLIPYYRPFPTVRVIAGNEYACLNAENRELLEKQDFVISNNSNRMGFRLSGAPIKCESLAELVSSAVTFGTIQLLPDGQLIVLMADHQTTGGYPRLAHVISRDLPLLAQLGASDKVAFHVVDVKHAEELTAEFEQEMRFLRIAALGAEARSK